MISTRRARATCKRLRGAPRRCFVCCVVFALLVQILPFTFRAEQTAGAAGRRFTQYLKPLQVCGDDGGPGGFLADHSWLPAPVAWVTDVPPAARAPEAPPGTPAPWPSRRLFRPPRA